MIYETMKVLTTLFLLFALCSFIWFAYEKRKDISQLVGDVISAGFMASALWLIWR